MTDEKEIPESIILQDQKQKHRKIQPLNEWTKAGGNALLKLRAACPEDPLASGSAI